MSSRRKFFKSVASGTALLAGIPAGLSFPSINQRLPAALTLVFQGDSITDAGRNKGVTEPNGRRGTFGSGYALMAAGHLMSQAPSTDWTIYNRGISGHKVFQLAERWDEDCIELQPDVLSILIGVNDFWHTLSNGYAGTSQVYATDLENLINRTKTALPSVKIILGEPFAIAGGSAVSDSVWRTDFVAYKRIAKELSSDLQLGWIPYQSIFDEALKARPVDYWCPDGVHPSVPGNYLMAKNWLEVFNTLFV